MDKKPLVSVVMATYNRAGYVKRSADSVLNQSFTDFELIIVDDGSSDSTKDVVSKIDDDRVVYVRNENNLRLQKSLNKGINLARGKYIARIDDQDRWSDVDKLKKQIDYLKNNPKCVLVGTGVSVEDLGGKEMFSFSNPISDKKIRNQILSRNCFVHSSVVFSKEAALSFGGYFEGSVLAEDYRLWLNLGTVGQMANLADHCVSYVNDSASLSHKLKKVITKENISIIYKHRKNYPKYYVALTKHLIRVIVYGYLNFDYSTSFISRLKNGRN